MHRSGKCKSSIGAGINFNVTVYRSTEDLTAQWAIYFSNLYDRSVSDDFDDDWERTVRTLINDTLDTITLDSSVCVSAALVQTLIRSLPRGKAGGIDGVRHEHLIYACDAISPVLARLFTGMLRLGYIPTDMKRGEIITLHKGGKKRKDDPNNYRAITLSSVILKLYELVLLERCQDSILRSLNAQQGGFQKQLGCNMTSFVLRETLHHAREQSSKVFVCCLDGKQAFDHVWHDGLFYKLLDLGVDDNTFVSIHNMYKDAQCHVRYNGLCSESFPIAQGTKQGGKSSPSMNIAFIDGLIQELEASGNGLCLYGLNVASPTLANDMVLLSFSKGGLDNMLDICYRYSCKWRYFL